MGLAWCIRKSTKILSKYLTPTVFNNNKGKVNESQLYVYNQMAYSVVDLIEIEPRLYYQLLTSSADPFPSAELLILETRIQTSEDINRKNAPVNKVTNRYN